MDFAIHLTWRGQPATVLLPVADPTLYELGQRIEEQLGASFETLKLLVPGRKGHIAPARQRQQHSSEAGLRNGCKALLLASKAEDVTQVRTARDLPGMRGFEDELRLAARRRRTARLDPQAPRAEYTFGAYEAWQRPGLHPPPGEALKLLYRLASDPGILGVMAAHRYRVGLLSEMPPEGKVGVSPVCVLGVNINAGQEISLRLRTDDLKGFRKYERIRETLIHELAHMEYGDHDNDFKLLNSQLARECAAINARYVGGHTLLAEEGSRLVAKAKAAAAAGPDGPQSGRVSELDDPSFLEGADGVMAATAQLSGRTLRQLAAAGGGGGPAASGGATGGVAAAAAAPPPAAADAGNATDPAGSGGGGSSSDDDVGDEVRQFEHIDAATERAEAAAQRLGSLDNERSDGAGGSGDGGWDGGVGAGGSLPSPAAAAAESLLQQAQAPADRAAAVPPWGASALVGSELGRAAQGEAPPSSCGAGRITAASGEPMDIDWRTETPGALPGGTVHGALAHEPPGSAAAEDAEAPAPSSAVQTQKEQLSPPTQPLPAPAPPLRLRLVLRPPEGLLGVAGGDSGEDGGGGGGGGALDAAQVKLRQAWDALARMAAAVPYQAAAEPHEGAAVPPPTAEDVGTALDTLETLLGNAVHFPTEDRYRQVRLGNGAFRRRVGRLPGGVELLRVAGFVEEGSGAEAVLRLRRNDPGLVWLALSVVREAREQVVAQLAAARAAAAGPASEAAARAGADGAP
ncbi:hypothetical protein PLESTM_001084800 [Pleodorina starrii]|nr:hypothetical protein PLESTM_001084800 [Pleodorina starrii]